MASERVYHNIDLDYNFTIFKKSAPFFLVRLLVCLFFLSVLHPHAYLISILFKVHISCYGNDYEEDGSEESDDEPCECSTFNLIRGHIYISIIIRYLVPHSSYMYIYMCVYVCVPLRAAPFIVFMNEHECMLVLCSLSAAMQEYMRVNDCY